MTLPAYCLDCDSLPCDCDSHDVHPRFVRGMVDRERESGFKTARWTQRLLDRGPIRIDPVSKAFWAYDNGVWHEARDVVSARLPTMIGDTFRRGDISHIEAYMYSKLLREDRVIYPDRPETRYVSLPSGLYVVDTGEVIAHDSEVLTTYQLQVEPQFGCPIPEFDDFLESVLHPGDWARVFDILAYLLLPGNPEQKALMFTGSGRNGKSVLMGVITAIIGRQYTSTISLSGLAGQFAAANLYGKAINLAGDIDNDHITHTGRFKQATGDDLVYMDVKHGKAFSAYVWAVPVFSANQIPTSADTSHGYLRRWEVVEFPNTFDGTDTTLAKRLHAELPAITGSLLRHATAHPFHIRESGPGRKAHAEFANRSDPVRSWLAETELTGFVKRADAHFDYRMWIEDGNGKTALTKNNFYARVSAVLGDPKAVRGERGWTFGS